MFTSEKIAHHSHQPQTAHQNGSFLQRQAEGAFFGQPVQQASFFAPSAVQAKLSVSQPDDPYEKEADTMADQVMRMPDPVTADTPKEEEEKKVQPKLTEAGSLQRAAAPEEEGEEKVQAKFDLPVLRKEQPEEEEKIQTKPMAAPVMGMASMPHAPPGSMPAIARKERGPPASTTHSFEQSLSNSKGAGSSLPDNTRTFMESRFQADFSGVKIHTGSTAEQLSRSIHAQAFTHGNDIYFNSDRYSPNTAAGGSLLAHELTHTIQQGASSTRTGVSPKTLYRKNMIQRSAEAAVPQMANAVEKAKSREGKVNANKPAPDGNRTGWEHLLDFFKTSFGEEKIVSSGGTAVEGAVAEADIKKKREVYAMKADPHNVGKTHMGDRDAMPSWCGIFVFWALNKGGVPMPKWQLGGKTVDLKAAYPPGYIPRPGDIAYRGKLSHYGIVESATGTTVRSVNGNTAGEDNLGGQIQTQEHPLSSWTAFFNPLQMMQGPLGAGESSEKPKTLRELRKELFQVDRKTDGAEQEEEQTPLQAKPELGSLSVDSTGGITDTRVQPREEAPQEKEEEEKQESASQPVLQKKQDYVMRARDNGPAANETQIATEEPVQLKAGDNDSSLTTDEHTGAQDTSEAQSRGPPLQLSHLAPGIQCSWLGDAWDAVSGFVSEAAEWIEEGLEAAKRWLLRKVRDFVQNIPGYTLLSLILGYDPITGEDKQSERTGRNLLYAGLEVMPLGGIFQTVIERIGAVNDVAGWIDGRLVDMSSLVAGIGQRFDQFWEGISLARIEDPEAVMQEVADLLHYTVTSIVNFFSNAAADFLEMIKTIMVRLVADFVREQMPSMYPLLRVALGFDPVTNEEVVRNGTNILYAALEVSEEGRDQRTKMMETGTFAKAAAWIDRALATFDTAYRMFRQAFTNIWDHVTIESLFEPVATFTQIYNDFAAPVALIWNFIWDLAVEILRLIKDALLGRLSDYAHDIRGFHLVTVIIGRNPFTGVRVPRTMENLIRGFMSLMEGGEEQFNQLKESGAIERTTRRINAAVARLNMTPAAIIQLFTDIWTGLQLRDLLHPFEAFERIMNAFGAPIRRLVNFVVDIIRIVVEVVLQIMNFPTDLVANIIAKAMLAFDMIKADPVGFLKNLLRAIKQGFIQFFDNIGTHLLNGLTAWLMSELRDANVRPPQDFSLKGIIGWVLEILGISMEKIWQKLAEHPRIGPQRVARIRSMINTLEGIWTFIKDVQERGMAAIWDKIQEQLSNLWDTILDAIKNWIMEQIVNKMITKLLSMLDPTGIMAVVNSAIALYSAIQSFIKYLREMLEIVNSFVEGVVEIASGNTRRAADFLEQTLARGVPIVIGFLANQVGLSGLGKRIGEMIEKAREMVDEALTWLVNKAVDTGGQLLEMGKAAAGRILGWLGLRREFTNENGERHTLSLRRTGSTAQLIIESTPMPLLSFINQFADQPGLPANKVQAANEARQFATTQVAPVLTQLNAAPEGTDTTVLEQQLLQKMVELTEKVRLLAGATQPLSSFVDKYNLEGAAGTFGSMPKPPGDEFTADHIPQNGLFEVIIGLGLFSAGSPMALHAADRTDAGYAMNEQDKRHKAGRTYGSKGRGTKNAFRSSITATIAGMPDVPQKKNAIVEAAKVEKNADIAAMRAVYARDLNDDVWKDVNDLPLTQTDKEALQTRIRNQANSGLGLLNSQNLDALKL